MRFFIFIPILLIILSACQQEESKPAPAAVDPLNIVTVNYPLYYFAERIGGEFVNAAFPVPGGIDPAYWTPDEAGVSTFQQADLIIANGAKYAKWMEKVSLPTSRIVNSSISFENEYVQVKEGVTHSHGPGGEHQHLGYAFTTWLNFKFAVQQAEAVKDAIIRKLPDQKAAIEANFAQLEKELSAIDQQMTDIAASLGTANLFGSHPVYQYLAAGYNLTILSEHWEPGQAPSAHQWRHFEKKLAKNPSAIMLWEDQPLASVESKLNDSGIRVAVFNPCGNRPESGDFISVMKENLQRLTDSLSPQM